MLTLGVTLVMSVLRSVVKNPKKAAEVRAVMLELYRAIGAAYADDPDFHFL